jgi:hypothetical protein
MPKFAKSLQIPSLSSKNFIQKIKFRQDGQKIYIQAKVNGDSTNREYILDTGSPSLFFTKAKSNLDLKTKRLYNFGKKNKAEYGFTDVEIGSLQYNNLSFLMMKPNWDFEQFGILGVNVMQNSIWAFNFIDSTITISDSIENFKNLNNYYKINFKPRKSQETPYIQAIINNKDTVSIMIDSGDRTFIKGYDWDKNKFEKKSENTITYQVNWNLYGSNLKKDSVDTKKYYRLKSLKIGDFEMNNIIVNGGVYQIGLGFLQNFDIVFDWISHQMYFKKNKKNEFPTNIASYGFRVIKYEGKIRVGLLYSETTASKMGVKLGSEILSINGTKASEIDKSILDKVNNKILLNDVFVFRFKGIPKEIRLKKENLF